VKHGKIQLQLDFRNDDEEDVSLTYDIKKVGNCIMNFTTNPIEGIGAFSGKMHVDRDVCYISSTMGTSPLSYQEVDVMGMDGKGKSYGCIFYDSNFVKSWRAVLTQVE
jgi:hypothetical protein